MPRLPLLSDDEIIRVLERAFGFRLVSQKGSHAKLRRREGDRIITTIVPRHREVARGTLKGALDLAEVSEEDFLRQL